MANICIYDIYATGTKEGLEKLKGMLEGTIKPRVINASYCSDMVSDGIKPFTDADGNPMLDKDTDAEVYTAHLASGTKWSVQGAMMERPDSDEECTLQTAARLTGCSMDIYSEESGNAFAEHIRIFANGEYEAYEAPFFEFDIEFVRDNLGDNPAKADVIALLSDMISEVTHLDDIENRLDFDAVYGKLIAEDYVAVGGFPERHDFPLAEY